MIRLLITAIPLVLFACRQQQQPPAVESARQQDEDMAKVNNDSAVKGDYDFAVEAADGSLLQMQLGELAMEKARSASVKHLGKSISSWHKRSNSDLHKVAHQKNVVLPNSLSDRSKKKYERLANADGEDFDREYTDMVMEEHDDQVSNFKKEAENGKDPDFKIFANNKLDTLKRHAAMSRSLSKQRSK